MVSFKAPSEVSSLNWSGIVDLEKCDRGGLLHCGLHWVGVSYSPKVGGPPNSRPTVVAANSGRFWPSSRPSC